MGWQSQMGATAVGVFQGIWGLAVPSLELEGELWWCWDHSGGSGSSTTQQRVGSQLENGHWKRRARLHRSPEASLMAASCPVALLPACPLSPSGKGPAAASPWCRIIRRNQSHQLLKRPSPPPSSLPPPYPQVEPWGHQPGGARDVGAAAPALCSLLKPLCWEWKTS